MNNERKVKLELFLNNKLPDCKEDLEKFEELLQNAPKHSFGKRKKIINDWFDNQDEKIQMPNDQRHWTATLRERIRTLKNYCFQHKAEEAERYSQEKNHREFYATLNAVYSSKTKSLYPVRTKNGELLTSRDKIKRQMGRTFQWSSKSADRSWLQHAGGHWTSDHWIIRWPKLWRWAWQASQKHQIRKESRSWWNALWSSCVWRKLFSFLFSPSSGQQKISQTWLTQTSL